MTVTLTLSNRYQLLFQGRASANLLGTDFHKAYIRPAAWVVFLSMLYPISWALSEGGNVISPNREMIFYGILDLLSQPVFLFFFLSGIRKIEYARFVWLGGAARAQAPISEKI